MITVHAHAVRLFVKRVLAYFMHVVRNLMCMSVCTCPCVCVFVVVVLTCLLPGTARARSFFFVLSPVRNVCAFYLVLILYKHMYTMRTFVYIYEDIGIYVQIQTFYFRLK